MAKCTGPLYSLNASGKLANAMVYFTWKGINVVREWLKPANPQSTGQGDQRIIVGGTGRSVGKIEANSEFAQQLIDLALVPGGQTKQSFMVKYILDHYLSTVTLYTTELANCTGHTAYTAFQAAADTLSIVEFDLDYAATVAYNKALGLYLIAKSAIALGFTGAPYTTALSSWTGAQIDQLVDDMTAA